MAECSTKIINNGNKQSSLCTNSCQQQKKMHQCDKLMPPECPFGCGEIKNQQHVLCCKHEQRNSNCKHLLRSMWLKCNEMSADPSLHDVLSHDIKQHFKEHPEIDQHNKCNRVLKLQNMMGWDQLLKGRISE